VVCFLANIITKKIILRGVEAYSKRSKNEWDDILVEEKVFRSLSHLVPAIIIEFSHEFLFRNFDFAIEYINRLTTIYIEVVIAVTMLSFINAAAHFLTESPIFKDKPIESTQIGQSSSINHFSIINILLLIVVG